jgi:NAD(P)-dependent dehydrogenase (short-subunit alcohol dehydrogenase family)
VNRQVRLAAEVARAVAFRSTDASDHNTGTCVTVDGGFLTGRPLMRAG